MIPVTGLLHFTIVTGDLAGLERFYIETFGARVLQRLFLDSAEFAAGTGVPGASAQTVHLMFGGSPVVLEITEYVGGEFRHEASADTPGYRHFALAVSDIDAAVAELRDKGVPVVGGGPVRLVTPVRVRGVAFVYVRDPDGNVVELVDTSRKGI